MSKTYRIELAVKKVVKYLNKTKCETIQSRKQTDYIWRTYKYRLLTQINAKWCCNRLEVLLNNFRLISHIKIKYLHNKILLIYGTFYTHTCTNKCSWIQGLLILYSLIWKPHSCFDWAIIILIYMYIIEPGWHYV